jgi:hypothetical protein
MLTLILRDKQALCDTTLGVCGLSPNASNQYGDWFVHKVCSLGDHELLETFWTMGVAHPCATLTGLPSCGLRS